MFTTFHATSPDQGGQGTKKISRTDQKNNPSSSGPRPKRSQVSRACEWCRLNRVKCDDNQPCNNCKNRGGRCSNDSRQKESRSLASSTREIERLKSKVLELEELLKTRAQSIKNEHGSLQQTSSFLQDPLEEFLEVKKYEDGVRVTNPQTQQTQLYGPSSSLYFITRMRSYLGTALQQPQQDENLQPKTASKTFTSPINLSEDSASEATTPADSITSGEYLSRTQEDYFLGLFWQSHHCTVPILNEVELRKHYESLWTSPESPRSVRKASALIDIILAVCMQYGIAFIPRDDASKDPRAGFDSNDASIAGRGYYRRCQILLVAELENPVISTLQCHIYSTIYLRNASFLNMAHSTLAVAVRTAHLLGINQKSPEDMPRAQQALERQLWWAIYILDSKSCIELGRPFVSQNFQISCGLPSDDDEGDLEAGMKFSSGNSNITWLKYHTECAKLMLVAREVSSAFYEKWSEALGMNNGKPPYNSPHLLETCADFLRRNMRHVQNWVKTLPDELKTPRKATGEPFSTDRSAVDIDLLAPLWLQRQRLLLELLYHNLAMILYRPFICFSTVPSSNTPLADGNAISCLNHAIAITAIVQQVLAETDILNGWHEAYQFQWNATLSMIGFSFAYPVCPPTPSARKTINNAISNFDTFANNFAAAASAANVTRSLSTKADILINRFRSSLTFSYPPAPSDLPPSRSPAPEPVGVQDTSVIVPNVSPSQTAPGEDPAENLPAGFTMPSDLPMDTFRVPFDAWDEFESLWSDPNGSNPDMWAELIGGSGMDFSMTQP